MSRATLSSTLTASLGHLDRLRPLRNHQTRSRHQRSADVAAILDSPEVAELVERIDGLKLRKRRGYGTRTLIGACLVRSIYALPTWTRTAELIAEHAPLRS